MSPLLNAGYCKHHHCFIIWKFNKLYFIPCYTLLNTIYLFLFLNHFLMIFKCILLSSGFLFFLHICFTSTTTATSYATTSTTVTINNTSTLFTTTKHLMMLLMLILLSFTILLILYIYHLLVLVLLWYSISSTIFLLLSVLLIWTMQLFLLHLMILQLHLILLSIHHAFSTASTDSTNIVSNILLIVSLMFTPTIAFQANS